MPARLAWGPFLTVQLDHSVLIQFAEPGIEIQPQHYAFLVSGEEIDRIYQRILDDAIEHSADPHWKNPGTYNTNHGGRGVYFRDPAGHGFEVLTSPYV